MGWIEGISNARGDFQVFGFHPPGQLLSPLNQSEDTKKLVEGEKQAPEELSRRRLQLFTNISNGASYLLGPLIMLVRLVIGCILAIQVFCYERQEYLTENEKRDISAAKEYIDEFFLRTLADLAGPFSAILDYATMKKKIELKERMKSLD